MINLLREEGPATATMLAQRLRQSTGSTSYHLRQLAQYGFVAEDPGRGSGRERWWRAVHRGTILESKVGRAALAETETYMRAVAALYADRVDRWLNEVVETPEEWRGKSTLSDWRFRLTPDEAGELYDALHEVLGRYRRDDPDVSAPRDARPYVVQAQLMPFLAQSSRDGAGESDADGPEADGLDGTDGSGAGGGGTDG